MSFSSIVNAIYDHVAEGVHVEIEDGVIVSPLVKEYFPDDSWEWYGLRVRTYESALIIEEFSYELQEGAYAYYVTSDQLIRWSDYDEDPEFYKKVVVDSNSNLLKLIVDALEYIQGEERLLDMEGLLADPRWTLD